MDSSDMEPKKFHEKDLDYIPDLIPGISLERYNSLVSAGQKFIFDTGVDESDPFQKAIKPLLIELYVFMASNNGDYMICQRKKSTDFPSCIFFFREDDGYIILLPKLVNVRFLEEILGALAPLNYTYSWESPEITDELLKAFIPYKTRIRQCSY